LSFEETPFDQIVQQGPADLAVLRRPRPQTQHVLATFPIHAQGHNQREIMEFLPVQQQHTQVQSPQRAFEHLLQLTAAGRLPLAGDRTLLDPVPVAHVVEHAGVVPCGHPTQDPLRHRLLHPLRMGERLIPLQRDLASFHRANPRPRERHLAPAEDHMAFVVAPVGRLPIRLMPIPRTGDLLDLLVDQDLHHQQARLTGGLFDRPGDLRQQRAHRQNHLKAGLAFGDVHHHGLVLEILHSSSGTTCLSLVAFSHHAVLSYG